MGTLVDHEIHALAGRTELIAPYDQKLLNATSIDVTLHYEILVEDPSPGNIIGWTRIFLDQGGYNLRPGEFILASTKERITLPSSIEATFNLKSSLGRRGLDHALSVYIDPGFSGQITLELKNSSRFRSILLEDGMPIGHLRFSVLSEIPDTPYSNAGRYNHQIGPTMSR
jgi:dCTP deaminase